MKTRCGSVAISTLVGLGIAAQVQALQLETSKNKYWRYEFVKVAASWGQTPTAASSPWPEVLPASVWRGAKLIKTVGDCSGFPLHRQKSGKWEGVWPVPFNPTLGEYTVKTSVWADGQTISAKADFEIAGRKPYPLPSGFSVVTDEGGKYGPHKTPGLNPEDKPGWQNMIQWAKYMGADAFWQCIGQTQVWGVLKEEQYPFSQSMIRLMPKVGEAAHNQGMQYGAWITAFVVIGDKPEATGYQYTLGYSRSQNALRQLRYVSLACDQRIGHIIALLKKFEADPHVDFLGLDYMRTDFGGYEFAEEFVRDFTLSTPPQWGQWSSSERSLWFARQIEVERDPLLRSRWEWWRAHRVALVIERIKEEVKPTKPLWVFSLGWQTGHQHGQDLLMMLDAGIGFNSPMFYSVDKPDYPHLLSSWKWYLGSAPASVVIGEPVDWNLLGRTLDPSGPQEHVDRQIQAVEKLAPQAAHFGLFWHDLARAHFGARGPYGSLEWALAGATAFTRLKTSVKRYPYAVDIQKPLELVLHRRTEIKVKVQNISGNTLAAVAVVLAPLPRLIRLDEEPAVLHNLEPYHGAQTVSLGLRVDQVYDKNGGKQMVAVRVQEVDKKDADPWFDFVYLPVTKELGPLPPDGNTPAAQGNTQAARTPAFASGERSRRVVKK
ncbi:hypothetical protein JW933_08000 [candidate division FCPU426 bacterium]|nr:hypothetical protein [candidate division FCPU426 bacterium]